MNANQFQINDLIDVEAFDKEINAELNDLTEAMRTQTARAAYYGVMLSKARTQANKVELIVKSIEASLTKKYRAKLNEQMVEEAEAAGNKKPERVTLDMVKVEVTLDPIMMLWENKRIHAVEVRSICQMAYEAFKDRKEMIVSMGHMTRAEMNSKLQAITKTNSENREEYQRRRAMREGGES